VLPATDSLLLFALPATLAPVLARILSQFSILREFEAVRRVLWFLLELYELVSELVPISVDCGAEFGCDVLGCDVLLGAVDG
jgi:hypothetical protein